jgi:hypothetical protein
MSKFIPAADRIKQAYELIQKARDSQVPPGVSRFDLSYVAQVKDLCRQAKDLVKFIPNSPSATSEMKEDVKKIFAQAQEVERGLLK